ncbi:hypothetical protein RHGRI_018346 [Rhododendron griersonianum]|uniref:DJ-1/PfpI domain-containing protein n=1 Tax=Rhododendron griersonianum TaxID=479676 RepID=A0AAV6K176_9ERIC|nr:hypothetical protein RHGRI_018346 [Rhododendron griersonianum]
MALTLRPLTLLSLSSPATITLTPYRLLRRPTPLSHSLFASRTGNKHSSISVMASAARKVLVPIANGSEPMEAVMYIDVLRRGGADVTVASVEKQLGVDACHGVKIVADALISECADTVYDLISLPGGMPGAATLRDCKILESMVNKQAADGRFYSAVCAAPCVALGSWGLLKGKKATCYPSFMEQLSSSAITVESRVQQDGNVVTSRGPGTTMELAVALVELLFGKDKADEVSGPLVMHPNPGADYVVHERNPMEWTFDTCPKVKLLILERGLTMSVCGRASCSGLRKILVPVADGSEEMEATNIIDILRRAKAEVVVASVEEKLEIVATRNVKLVADVFLDEALNSSYDLVVLPGKKATAFPPMCDKLSDQSEIENRVVVDGNLITSRGPGTSMEFGLAIVEKFFGREKALELAKAMIVVKP